MARVFVMYFNTSGGAFSLEGLVAEVGPGASLLILLLLPLVWAIPETMIVAELASMLPVEGGYYRWVQRAFGRFAAFQNGWMTWVYSLLDMAIYPVLFNQYLASSSPGSPRWSSGWWRWRSSGSRPSSTCTGPRAWGGCRWRAGSS